MTNLLAKISKLAANMRNLSANISSGIWNFRFQHSGLSARLDSKYRHCTYFFLSCVVTIVNILVLVLT